MSRRTLAVVSGLFVSSWLAAVAFGQTPSRTPTLAERMSALRQGWSQGGQQPSGNQAQSNRSAPTSSRPAAAQFGPAQSSAQPQQTEVRTAARPRAGSVQSNSGSNAAAEGFTLPGLGGSRLPSTANRPADNTTDISRELSADYPVIGGGNNRSATAQRYAAPSSSASAPATGGAGAVRSSPQQRSALHVNPGDLQRELVGGFTLPSDDSASTTIDATNNEAEPLDKSADATPAAPTESSLTITAEEVDPWSKEESEARETNNSEPASAAPITTEPRPAPPSSRSNIDLRSGFAGRKPIPAQRPAPQAAAPVTANPRQAFGHSTTAADDDSAVLSTQQTPVITTDIRGPRQIVVNREATYRVRLVNQGNVPAEGLVASIRIPSWADVMDTTTSNGTIQQTQHRGTTGTLEWQLAHLDAHTSETLDVRLIPRNSRPLELGVSWTIAPVGSRAIVEVQEPKLTMSVTGPEEVLYGKPQLFRLTIANPGTGTAENIKIDLMPPGGGESAVSSHPLGDLPAGTSKSVEVELTARDAGKLFVKARAVADGGLASDAEQEIFCRKPELEVDWRGPEEKYSGTPATYFFRVRNPGTAPAEDVTVRVALPPGAEFISSSEGQSLDTQRREVTWRVGSLGPGDDFYMELKCLMTTPGPNQLRVTAATNSADLSDTKLAETNVVALADLKLEVSDPSGPVAVGDQAVYEIRVFNRGASAAKDVNIVALFSEGIEPDQVEGAMNTVADGRVTFKTIEELPAGRQVTVRIRAHALQAGTHIFRAEVLCRDLEIKLAAEETTRFYADDLPSDEKAPAPPQSAGRYEQAEPGTVRQ